METSVITINSTSGSVNNIVWLHPLIASIVIL